jgi:hypothetical protein
MPSGELQQVNREHRPRRIEAAARGLRFPSSRIALAKLCAALAGSIAGNQTEIIRSVFED